MYHVAITLTPRNICAWSQMRTDLYPFCYGCNCSGPALWWWENLCLFKYLYFFSLRLSSRRICALSVFICHLLLYFACPSAGPQRLTLFIPTFQINQSSIYYLMFHSLVLYCTNIENLDMCTWDYRRRFLPHVIWWQKSTLVAYVSSLKGKKSKTDKWCRNNLKPKCIHTKRDTSIVVQYSNRRKLMIHD